MNVIAFSNRRIWETSNKIMVRQGQLKQKGGKLGNFLSQETDKY